MSIHHDQGLARSTSPGGIGLWLADRFERQPRRFFHWLLAGQVVLWSAVPVLFFHSLPLDLVENVGWGREWQLGYYKHPPLQAWVTGLAIELAGNRVWPLFLLGPLAIGATLVAIFKLGSEAGGERAGLLAAIFFSLAYYSGLATPEFNANIVQMPIWAWAGFILWRAIHRGRSWWILLGMVLALAVYAKYSAVVLVATLIVAALSLPAGRASLRRPGPYVASLTAVLLTAPHFAWLMGADWLPVAYASKYAVHLPFGSLVLRMFGFLRTQVLDLVAGIALLAIGGGLWLGRRAGDGVELPSAPDLRRYVLILAFAPFVVASLASLATGIGLHDMWGAPMVAWVGLALVLLPKPAYVASRMPAMLTIWLALFLGAPAALGLVAAVGPSLGMKPLRTGWPSSELAIQLSSVWHRQTSSPLRLVAGGTWESGILSAYSPDAPSVIAEGDLRFNPWVDAKRLEAEGVMVVWDLRDFTALPDAYRALGPFTVTGVVSAPYPGSSGEPARFGYAIRPPHAS